jgi:hypothetical protein
VYTKDIFSSRKPALSHDVVFATGVLGRIAEEEPGLAQQQRVTLPHKWTRAPAGARMKRPMESALKPGQLVRVNLAGMQVESVTFHAAVTDAVGNIVKQTSEDPPKYLVRLLFSFRGINEVEVPADRIHAG